MTQPDSTTNTGAVEALVGACKPFAYVAEPIVSDSGERWQPNEWMNRLVKLNVGQFRALYVALAALRATPTPASEAEVIERAAAEIERVTALNVKARRDRADDALAFEFQGLGDVLAKVVRALSPHQGTPR